VFLGHFCCLLILRFDLRLCQMPRPAGETRVKGLTMDRWEKDIHTPHWHGATVVHNGNRIDVTEIFPAVAKTMK